MSLVALPISIALALASGAPAIAGIITAVIGGIVVAHLGGSYVTITGAGNGLVVITASTIAILSPENPLQGYYMALAAVAVSGVLVFLLGLLRIGIMSDLFPTSAVQGMLAAIGIGILAKQLHVMIGHMDPVSSTPLALLGEFKDGILHVMDQDVDHWKTTAIGVLSLVFMFVYSKIPWRWVHVIPAPLWIVIFAVAVQMGGSYYYGGSYIPEAFLVDIPKDWMSSWQMPDFSAMNRPEFWTAAVALAFIASLESLLSIKGMDRLDPYKRKSHVNKDLRALGLATVVSGLLGGLNVVTVIARSSVNVNNEAKTRSSNFFHGLFILLFVLGARNLITQIPMPALASILVYTGYKLLNPAQFLSIARVGTEQLLIFVFTLIATLVFGLIYGILLGMVATLFVQMFLTGSPMDIVRYFYRPNTLLYEESDQKYILNVNYFSNFLNYPRLKSKLDSVPPSATLIADFSDANFVDHTVMDHLSGYEELFSQKGGRLDIVGLDEFAPAASHPLGVQTRRNTPKGRWQELKKQWRLRKGTELEINLSGKQTRLSNFAVLNGLEFQAWPPETTDGMLEDFLYFRSKRIDYTTNELLAPDGSFSAIEVYFHEGEFIVKDGQHMAVAVVRHNEPIPEFVLDRERIFERLAQFAGVRDIETKNPMFNSMFQLKGPDKTAICDFMKPGVQQFLLDRPGYHMESNGKDILIFHKERVSSVAEFKLLVTFAKEWALLHSLTEGNY